MILEFENKLWEASTKERPEFLTDTQIEERYDQKSERIVTETNREKLPNFYKSLSEPGYMNTRPFYQRRSRWDKKTQSKLIESILINIPIPPLFVYEIRSNVHEVMDGQQRITAIKAFYSNELILEGLDRWPELNGRTYSKLPKAIRDGIDRRSITWISVLKESTESPEEAMLLKQLVFERLNTGGTELGHQEIRNALYAGDFNDALVELSKNKLHRDAWGLPEYSEAEETGCPEYLARKKFYTSMEDVEVILRFFALRNVGNYQRGMRGFLDLYMFRSRSFTEENIKTLQDLYIDTLETATNIYSDKLFKTFDPESEKWSSNPQKAFADAVLVAISNNLHKKKELVIQKDHVIEKTIELFKTSEPGALTGRGNTKKDIQGRINLVTEMLNRIGE